MPSKQWYGCLPDYKDRNDLMMSFGAPPMLPQSVDLREHCPPVMNQSALGSCTAHGVTGCARYHIIRRGTTYDFEMSRLQLYWDTREIEGTVESDSGAMIRDVVKTLAKRGVGHEEIWPYDISRFTERPPQEVYDDAVQYKALRYERVPVSTQALKIALANGHPVVIGIAVYDSFEGPQVAQSGVVPLPYAGESMVGGHCMYVVGYGQREGHFTVRNSWGADWGDNGDCYIPERYLGSTEFGSDYWLLHLFGSEAEQQAGVA